MRRSPLLSNRAWLCLAAMLAVVVVHPAYASNVLDSIGSQYQSASKGWESSLQTTAKQVFVSLATLELVWAGIWWTIERDDPNAVMSSMFKKIMGLMFFWAILLNFQTWIPAIINGFSFAGQTAAGVTSLTPSSVLDTGLQLSTNLFSQVSVTTGFLTSIVAGICGILIVLAFTVIAGQMLVTLIESYFAVSAGVLFLGLSGSRWTSTFSEKYISYSVSIGVKLFVTYLIIGAGQNISSHWNAMIQAGTDAKDYLPVMGGAFVYMFLAWQIPSMASSMLSGTVSMTLGGAAATMATTAGAVAGGVGLAAGAAAGAAGLAKGAVGAASGIAQAAGAATANAAARGASTPMSMVSGAMGAVGGAIAGAAGDAVKGLGQSSSGGQLANRINASTAAMTDKAAMAGSGPANGAVPAPTSGTGAGGAGTGGAGAPSSSVPIPSSSQSRLIDTSTSLSQALDQRNSGSSATRPTPPAPSEPASAASEQAATGAGVTYPTGADTASSGNNTPNAPSKSSFERMTDGLSAMSQTPNDSAAGVGIQIDMKHSRE